MENNLITFPSAHELEEFLTKHSEDNTMPEKRFTYPIEGNKFDVAFHHVIVENIKTLTVRKTSERDKLRPIDVYCSIIKQGNDFQLKCAKELMLNSKDFKIEVVEKNEKSKKNIYLELTPIGKEKGISFRMAINISPVSSFLIAK